MPDKRTECEKCYGAWHPKWAGYEHPTPGAARAHNNDSWIIWQAGYQAATEAACKAVAAEEYCTELGKRKAGTDSGYDWWAAKLTPAKDCWFSSAATILLAPTKRLDAPR